MASRQGNPTFIRATLWGGLSFYGAWRSWYLYGTPYSWVPVLLAIMAGVNALSALSRAASYLYNQYLMWEAFSPSDLKGTAAWATPAEIRKAGLYKTDGLFLGCDPSGHPIFFDGETHGLTLSPAGGGKTTCQAIPVLCHSPMSIIVTDLKGTLRKQTGELRKKRHKHRIITIDPAGINGPGANRYNPVQILMDDWEDPDGHKDLVADAQDMALQLLPEPPVQGENFYFRNGSRKIITFCLLFLVTQNGRKPTLGNVLRLIRNVSEFMDALYAASFTDILNRELADMAQDLLSKFQAGDNQRQTESFREGAEQALNAFAPSGFLEESTSTCDFRFRDLKEEPATVYIIADPNKMKVFAPWLGLLGWAAVRELTRCRNTKPVLFLLDEATNFKIEGLPGALTALREYGVRCWFLFQELEEFARVYGRPALETLMSQTEVKQIFGVQSQKTAELVSQMLGEETVKTANYSLGHDFRDLVQKSVSDSARRLLSPDEIRRLPENESILFVRNLKPIRAEKVTYAQVYPWKKWVGVNPLFGKKLKGKTRLWLSYFWSFLTGRPRVKRYRKMKYTTGTKRPLAYSLGLGLALAKGILAFVPLMALIGLFSMPRTPHVLTYYERYGLYTECTYWGMTGRVEKRLPDNCPLFTMAGEAFQPDVSSYIRSMSSIFD